jgi:DNA-binding transcriptional regulator YiaG
MTPAAVRQARDSLGLSQANLAKILGVSTRQVQRWEAGDQAPPNYLVLALAWLAGGCTQPEEAGK